MNAPAGLLYLPIDDLIFVSNRKPSVRSSDRTNKAAPFPERRKIGKTTSCRQARYIYKAGGNGQHGAQIRPVNTTAWIGAIRTSLPVRPPVSNMRRYFVAAFVAAAAFALASAAPDTRIGGSGEDGVEERYNSGNLIFPTVTYNRSPITFLSLLKVITRVIAAAAAATTAPTVATTGTRPTTAATRASTATAATTRTGTRAAPGTTPDRPRPATTSRASVRSRPTAGGRRGRRTRSSTEAAATGGRSGPTSTFPIPTSTVRTGTTAAEAAAAAAGRATTTATATGRRSAATTTTATGGAPTPPTTANRSHIKLYRPPINILRSISLYSEGRNV